MNFEVGSWCILKMFLKYWAIPTFYMFKQSPDFEDLKWYVNTDIIYIYLYSERESNHVLHGPKPIFLSYNYNYISSVLASKHFITLYKK